MLTEAQVVRWKALRCEFESEHPGYCGAQDTFYVGIWSWRVYQQTFIDTYAKVACAKLYDRDADHGSRFAQRPGDPVLHSHDVKLLRYYHRGSEYCASGAHEYELYLAVETSITRAQTEPADQRYLRTLPQDRAASSPYRVPQCIVQSTSCSRSRSVVRVHERDTSAAGAFTPMQTFLVSRYGG